MFVPRPRSRRLTPGAVGATLAVVAALAAGCSGSSSAPARTSVTPAVTTGSTPPPAPTIVPSTSASPLPTKAKSTTAAPSTSHPPKPAPRPTRTSKAKPSPRALPLGFTTGTATQVLTVTASSTSSTSATLQAWTRSGGGWRKHGSAIPARLGSAGLSRHASEQSTATPIGSFTLTQAFGHDSDPGTALPYTHTTPDDWWVSQAGPLYNTRQRCASGCAFKRGDPNEHLYYETPYYDYAVVIDYNTRNAPGGVKAGRGSAFFLHVTVDPSTQGCVSIPKSDLVQVMRWLRPSAHPRILIGVD